MAERAFGRTGQRQNGQRQTTIAYLISSRDIPRMHARLTRLRPEPACAWAAERLILRGTCVSHVYV
jgi:hypothetical protein